MPGSLLNIFFCSDCIYNIFYSLLNHKKFMLQINRVYFKNKKKYNKTILKMIRFLNNLLNFYSTYNEHFL